ncbi:hypothetical protein GCM10010443_93200 [Actinoplanes cyaneus]
MGLTHPNRRDRALYNRPVCEAIELTGPNITGNVFAAHGRQKLELLADNTKTEPTKP